MTFRSKEYTFYKSQRHAGIEMVNELKYETPAWTRRSDILFCIILCVVVLPLMLGAAFGFASVLQTGMAWPAWTVWPVGFVLALFGARLIWRCMRERLRFGVTLGADALRLGNGRWSKIFGYDEIEFMQVDKRSTPTLIIKSAASECRVFLAPDEIDDCAEELHDRCRNSVYMDCEGEEHLPTQSDRPLYNLQQVERHCFKSAITQSVLAIGVLLLGGLSVYWLATGGAVRATQFKLILCLISAPLFLKNAWKNFKKVQQARQARDELTRQGVVDN